MVTGESARLGRVVPLDGAAHIYGEFCAGLLPRDADLSRLRAVVDCANGATSVIAPQVLGRMLKDVVAIGASPSGRNINDGCGGIVTLLGLFSRATYLSVE